MKPTIRDAAEDHAAGVARTYNHYIASSIATFETDPLTAAEILQRMNQTVAAGLPWIVGEQNGELLGYAYGSNWSSRLAYSFSVETTVYVAPDQTGQGIGLALYAALLDRLRAIPKHVAIARIALPNSASVAVHEKLGFRKAGHFAEVGYKFDRWIDVGYWQLMLQEQSTQ